MDNTARTDSKRLRPIGEPDATMASAPTLRAKRKHTSGSAEADPSASPQTDPPNPPMAPKPRTPPPLKAMPAAAKAASSAPGALKIAAPLSAAIQSPLDKPRRPLPRPLQARLTGSEPDFQFQTRKRSPATWVRPCRRAARCWPHI